jgi:hypothetical protein
VEVPEISEGLIDIVNVAREPGKRGKIAVRSKDKDIDPVGACVGMRGSRVQSVVQELRGEKIDIIPYSDDAAKYVSSSLSPAKVNRVFVDDDNRTMTVIVPDDQLSLAIGKNGQNVRLAVKLTGWNIDMKISNGFTLFSLDFIASLNIYNVLNHLEENNVNSITGRAGPNAYIPEIGERRYVRIDEVGAFTHEEADYNPSWYARPRFIQIGLGIQF